MSDDLSTSPTRPYLVRALHEWIEDNGLTPYMLVDATIEGVIVPTEYVQDGQIVLNVSSNATGGLELGNEYVHFNARFGGMSRELWIPLAAVMGIYSKESSQGMFFDPNEYDGWVDPNADSENAGLDANDADTESPNLEKAKAMGLKILK